jgi:hypothetical protein
MPETIDSAPPRSRFLRRILSWVIGVAIVLALVIPLLHVLLRPIPPGQEPPNVHFGEPCIFCHFVTDHADPVEVN